MIVTAITGVHRAVAWVRRTIKPQWRETGYRLVSGVIVALGGLGVLHQQEAALWTQLGTSLVTTLFAALFATSTLRRSLYLLTAPVAGLLTWYATVTHAPWVLIAAVVVQVFSVTTAAAKTVQPLPVP